jgi:hypothetical protein
MEVRNHVHHNTVVGAIQFAELGDGIMPTPRVTLKLGRMPYDPLNLWGAVQDNDGGELVESEPWAFAVT